MTLPVLHVEGGPHEQGLIHGRELKDRIEHNLDVYFNRFAKEVGLSRDEVLDHAAPFATFIEQKHSDYHEGVKGIAEGAGVDLMALTAMNVRYEILYYQFGVQAMADGCTAFAVKPEASANGHLLIGQNWDWIPEVKGAVIHSTEASGLQVLGFTEAGIFGRKIGLNNAGMGLAINGMTSTDDDWDDIKTPFHVRCYHILNSSKFDDAVKVVTDEDRVCAANFMIAQTPDHVVDIEAAPKTVRLLECDRGRLAHTNHFFDPDVLGIVEPPMENRPHSHERQRRMTELLQSKDKVSANDVKQFLEDKQGFPYSINRHGDPEQPPEERYITVTGVVMDLHTGEIQLTDGPPDLSEYQSVTLMSEDSKAAV
jgi:isopenicillin-N N-acyltransferase-like protein